MYNPIFAYILIVAINIRFFTHKALDGYGNFVKQIVAIWLQQFPQHHFILITDNNLHGLVNTPNSTIVQAGVSARHPILWHLWYNFTLPKILKKYNAQVFLSPDGFCSLRTKLPQVMVIHDLAYVALPKMFPKSHLIYFKKIMPTMAYKAKAICTVSNFSKADIIEKLKIPAAKLHVVYSGVKPKYMPLTYQVIAQTQQQYTNGLPYFLHIGTITPRKNIMALLKAFSQFKRMQKSNIKLVLVGKVPNNYKAFKTQLSNYKYRADVVLIETCTDATLAHILGSAYALVYPSLYEGFGVPPLEAMQAGVPVIASGVTAIPEICGNAAHYIDPQNINDIYNGLKTIYINETYKNQLIKNGLAHTLQYTWERTAQLIWDVILKVV